MNKYFNILILFLIAAFSINGQDITNLGSMLQQRLGIDCHPIELQNFLAFKETESTDTITSNCLIAIGGALRSEH